LPLGDWSVGRCAACREALPGGANFCPSCGQEVRAQPSDDSPDVFETFGIESEQERRYLTAVFCDLVGSTELSSTIDPEEFTELIEVYQKHAVAVARRFAGDVEGYSGDGISFRFGWPEAHDDDAAQALRAALEIVATVEELDPVGRLRVRAGVHSGLAVVGEMGGSGRRATMSQGETLNLAARLQTVAEPGTVVASAATLALVEGLFLVAPLGASTLKGIAEPIEVFRVVAPTGVRSRLEAAAERLTPFVGRRADLDVLSEKWASGAAGHGAAVLLAGEPGVGKSRLADQLRDLVSGQRYSWLDCSCSPYTQMSVLWPVARLIEHGLGLLEDDDPQTRLGRLRAGLGAAGVDLTDAVELVAAVLGLVQVETISMAPDRRLERTVEVLVAWIRALSRPQPLVLLVEDLHWCDPTSLDVLDELMATIGSTALLLLLTARPEFSHSWQNGDMVTRLDIEPFDDVSMRQLVAGLSGPPPLPAAVVDRIVESAAGIPLFAEEVGRAVLESGILVAEGNSWRLTSALTDLSVPQTLQGSLLARLDRLGPAKGVAQLAATIGRDFRFDLLAELSGLESEALRVLLDRLLDSDLLVPVDMGGEPGYSFRHILIQEVAYESLLRRTRRTVHERIAQLLTDRIEAGRAVLPEVIGHHYEAAGLLGDAAECYRLAAAQAVEGSGYREAIAFLRHALSLVMYEPEGAARDEAEVEMLLALGSAIIATKSYADPEIEATYERARELCERLGNDNRVGLALAGLSIYYINRGETLLGTTIAERVLAIALAHADDTLELLARVQLALARNNLGESKVSLDHSLRAIQIYDPDRHRGVAQRFGTDQGVAAHIFAGWGCLLLGYLDEGLAHMNDGVALAEALDQPFQLVYALTFRATAHWERGESAETLHEAGRARALAEEQGFEWWGSISALWEVAERLVRSGDSAELPELLDIASRAAASGNRGGSTNVMARVAEGMRAAGDGAAAILLVEMALETSAETNQPWWDASLHRMRAEILFDRAAAGGEEGTEDPGALLREAEGEWQRAMTLAEERGHPVHGLRAAVGYARYLGQQGRPGEAESLLRERLLRCPEGADTPVIQAAVSALADLEQQVAGD
jgi:class 3 adenylate cyclase/tetratricopeptide (TPR) repeat protein